MKKKTQRAPGQTTLTISLPEELKAAILKAAENDQRSASNFVVVELAKLVEQKGLLIHTPTKETGEAER